MALLRRRRRRKEPAPELVLGTVTFPTGDLLLIDFGLLGLWSGSERPGVPDGLSPEGQARAAGAVDVVITGPDAMEVAAQLDLASLKGRYAFDTEAAFVSEQVAATGLRAHVEVLDRVPHRRRVELLLADSPHGAEVPFHGPWAVAVRGLPRDRVLRVLGERMEPGPDETRWRSVWVEVSLASPASSRAVGHVLVDEARLVFADPASLDSWVIDAPADGLVDVVFWGGDGEQVAAAVGAPSRPSGEDGVFGWTDLDEDQVRERAQALKAQRDAGRRFAVDFRPHDDAYRLLALARASPTGSGTVDVDGAELTGFFTSWGDGAFPVFVDRAADGSLCRVRVELGADENVMRQRELEERRSGEPG